MKKFLFMLIVAFSLALVSCSNEKERIETFNKDFNIIIINLDKKILDNGGVVGLYLADFSKELKTINGSDLEMFYKQHSIMNFLNGISFYHSEETICDQLIFLEKDLNELLQKTYELEINGESYVYLEEAYKQSKCWIALMCCDNDVEKDYTKDVLLKRLKIQSIREKGHYLFPKSKIDEISDMVIDILSSYKTRQYMINNP